MTSRMRLSRSSEMVSVPSSLVWSDGDGAERVEGQDGVHIRRRSLAKQWGRRDEGFGLRFGL